MAREVEDIERQREPLTHEDHVELSLEGFARDDQKCVLVMILPVLVEGSDAEAGFFSRWFGGASQSKNKVEYVEEAEERYKEVFETHSVPEAPVLHVIRDGLKKLRHAIRESPEGQISQKKYQNIVRAVIVKLLSKSGITMESFTSIDRDEVFVKLDFKDDLVLGAFAERVLYRMQFHRATYRSVAHYERTAERLEKLSPEDKMAREDVPRNHAGEALAYHYFELSEEERAEAARRPRRNTAASTSDVEPVSPGASVREAPKVQYIPFRAVDKIRLMFWRLRELFDIADLEAQGVAIQVFPASQLEDQMQLADNWLGGLHPCQIGPRLIHPKHWFGTYKVAETMDEVRDYFGEQIGFFFMFYRLYIAMLLVLTILCLPFLLTAVDKEVRNQEDDDSYFMFIIRSYEDHFGDILTIWASLCVPFFVRETARAAQRWGMRDMARAFEPTRRNFNAQIGQATRLARNIMSYVLFLGFCFLFLVSLSLIILFLDGTAETLATSALVKVFSFLWSTFAKMLVELQNHRVESTMLHQLSIFLVTGKLFLYLFPFLRIVFLDNFIKKTCAPTYKELAEAVFSKHGWPTGVEKDRLMEWFPEYTYSSTLRLIDFNQTTQLNSAPGHQVAPEDVNMLGFTEEATKNILRWKTTVQSSICAYGCVPQECRLDEHGTGTAVCETNCFFTLTRNLQTLYLFHIVTTVLFVLIPIVLAKMDIQRELWKARHEERRGNHEAAAEKKSTTLQLQAKKGSRAPYGYLEWGGSFVDDILEIILGHSLLVCFGVFLPRLAPFAFLTNLIEYSLIAYRMIAVTGRPYPHTAPGIGLWKEILDFIGLIGCVVNGGLVAFFIRNSYTRETPEHKLIAFFMTTGWFLALRLIFRSLVLPEEPWDVLQVDYRNEEFKQQLNSLTALHVEEAAEAKKVNITYDAPPAPKRWKTSMSAMMPMSNMTNQVGFGSFWQR